MHRFYADISDKIKTQLEIYRGTWLHTIFVELEIERI